MKIILPFLAAFSLAAYGNQGPAVSTGRIERLESFPSENVAPRNVDVWLPQDYDPSSKYAVIYMHDGQMLFDSTITWNRQEWCADEVASRLISENGIRPCIIVGIWNNDKYRYPEYYPEKALTYLSKWRQSRFIRKSMMGEALGDEYLRFIVSELKPYIDSHYSTFGDRDNTFIMGSSMGGLISLYAICEYPEVFGGAGCLSTHLPMKGVHFLTKRDNRFARAFRKYLKPNLPDPATHKIYFDHGTNTLDKWYGPYQKKVDSLMSAAGYAARNWITVKYEGQDHSERSWSSRLDIPFKFLAGK